jgi:hypothetical protein
MVEILSVVAIVTVLAAVLLPAVQNAMRMADTTKCMANMRAIGQAFYAYADDHDDAFPPAVLNRSNWTYWSTGTIWDYAMNRAGMPYSASMNYWSNYNTFIFRCPSSDPTIRCSYSLNVMFPAGVKDYDNPRKRSSVSKPSSCLLLGEGTNHALDSWWFAAPPGQPMTFPHGPAKVGTEESKLKNRQNLLFMDMHMESRLAKDIPRGGWGSPETTNSFWTGN